MNETPSPTILRAVERYYADRLREFGPTPRGVDWNSAESQSLRFERLLTLVEPHVHGSILDLGCGYGALVEAVRGLGIGLAYRGIDISPEMVAAARARYVGEPDVTFSTDLSTLAPATYAVASGIFNVKLQHDATEWDEYVLSTLVAMDRASERGFAFNMLSTYSDVDRRRDTLYYADPRDVFDLCKRRFSPRVALLHDYPLYEFTVLVRK